MLNNFKSLFNKTQQNPSKYFKTINTTVESDIFLKYMFLRKFELSLEYEPGH